MDATTLIFVFYILYAVSNGVIGAILILGFYLLMNVMTKRATQKKLHTHVIIYRSITAPIIFLIASITILTIMRAIAAITAPIYPPIPVMKYIFIDYSYIIYCIVFAWLIRDIIQSFFHLYRKNIRKISPNKKIDSKILSFLEITINYIIWIIAFFIILALLAVDITPFIAAGGFLGIGIGIITRSFFENFFSGLVLASDQPFKIGDRIKIRGDVGNVLSIGMRSCLIKTIDNRTIAIPNRFVESDVVTNFSEPDPRLQLSIPLQASYGTDIDCFTDLVLNTVKDCTKKHDMILDNPKPKLYLQNFDLEYLNFTLSIWINNFSYENDAIDIINRSIQKRFGEEEMKTPDS